MKVRSDFIDIAGKKFGKLTAVEIVSAPEGKSRGLYWRCDCECGGTRIVKGHYLRRGDTTDCGCVREQKRIERDSMFIGKKFGKLSPIYRIKEKIGGEVYWHCECDCKNEVNVRESFLLNGTTKSCGCLKIEIENLIGNTYGKLMVMNFAGMRDGISMWDCLCYCGNYVTVAGISLKTGNTKSCGCYFYKITEEMASNLVGQRFGRLVAIELVKIYNGVGKSERQYKCQCDCGNYVTVRGTSLTFDQTRSCGCLQKEIVKKEFGEASFNKVYSAYQGSAKKRELDFLLTKDEAKHLMESDCYYCGKSPERISKNKYNNGDFIYNGIDRVDSSKGYYLHNCVPCCKKCNTAKLAMKREDFFDWVKEVFYHSIYKKEENV